MHHIHDVGNLTLQFPGSRLKSYSDGRQRWDRGEPMPIYVDDCVMEIGSLGVPDVSPLLTHRDERLAPRNGVLVPPLTPFPLRCSAISSVRLGHILV